MEPESEEMIQLKIVDETKIEQTEEDCELRQRFRSPTKLVEEERTEEDRDMRESEGRSSKKKKRWTEKDPETNQTFTRTQQNVGLFSVTWGGGSGPEFISRQEAWKLYIKKLQEESNYLLASPDKEEICCCNDCIFEYELQCNETLGWRRRSPTVEGFTQEVNQLCDPSAPDVLSTIIQERYRSLPCTIM